MVFSPIGAREDEIYFRNIGTLRAELGFTGFDEMREFLGSSRFKPYLDEYADKYIRPQQRAAQAVGGVRGRGPLFVTVEERMMVGERAGSDKFSTLFPDKSRWDGTE